MYFKIIKIFFICTNFILSQKNFEQISSWQIIYVTNLLFVLMWAFESSVTKFRLKTVYKTPKHKNYKINWLLK